MTAKQIYTLAYRLCRMHSGTNDSTLDTLMVSPIFQAAELSRINHMRKVV